MNSINSMGFHLLLILSLLCLVLAGSNTCLPDEEHWKSLLPNTPLPKALEDLSQPCEMERKGAFLNDDMVMNSWNDKKYENKYQKHYRKTYDHIHHGPIEASISKSTLSADDLSGTTLFFSYHDLYPGRKMTLPFENAGSRASFLPHDVANSIPFSSDHLSEIFEYFRIRTQSEEAELIKDTIEECEYPNRKGEVKLCSTSLKSMIDFAVARLGRNVKVLSNQSGKEQEYTVLMAGMRKIGDKPVTCHKEVYPYAVYYCHQINGTEVFVVPLIAGDGSKVKAVTICHNSFELPKAKPGTKETTICHFLANDTLVWAQNNDPPRHDLVAHFAKPGINDHQVGVSLM